MSNMTNMQLKKERIQLPKRRLSQLYECIRL
jgi:hypothetical protein